MEEGKSHKFDTDKLLKLCRIYGETIDRVMPYPVMSDGQYRELQRQIVVGDLEDGRIKNGFNADKLIKLCRIYGETIDRVMPYPVMDDERYRELQRQIKDAGLGLYMGTDVSEGGKLHTVKHAFVKPEETRTEVELFIMSKFLLNVLEF